MYGTSASCPAFASIIAIINEQRYAQGKKSIGFLNPTLYKNADVLNDIVGGSNPNCGTQGFTAVPGWDPVTGYVFTKCISPMCRLLICGNPRSLGTPNVPRMLQLFLKMT